MKITAIRLMRMRLPLDPPFYAAWDPLPRRHFDATLARAQAAVAAKAAGFRAMKIRISRTDWVSSLEAVRATRAAVGEDVAIMADLNQWWRMPGDLSPALDETQVRRIAAELAELGVFFPYDPPGWTPERRDFFLTEPVRIDAEGCLAVPDTPGLGASIDHAAVARYRQP